LLAIRRVDRLVASGVAEVEWRAVVPEDDSDDHESTRPAAMTTSNDVVPITLFRPARGSKEDHLRGSVENVSGHLGNHGDADHAPTPRDAAINSITTSKALVARNLLHLDASGKVILV